MQKGIVTHIRIRTMERMPISARLTLFDEVQSPRMLTRGPDIRLAIAGREVEQEEDDEGDHRHDDDGREESPHYIGKHYSGRA